MTVDNAASANRIIRVADGVSAINSADWDRLASAGKPLVGNPFVGHAFLSLLEQSGSIGPGTGWQPIPLLIEDEQSGAISGALPAYLKHHSQGEYVFDHGWAEAYEQAGGHYYPKVQIAVPFTPVPGPRLLAADDDSKLALIKGAEALVEQNGFSSAHATFLKPDDLALFKQAGWLIRTGSQFHWHNDNYQDFDAFLASLASRKRKAIRKERAAAQDATKIIALSGDDIKPAHWDAMWQFYQDTGARKWGSPYLTREAFDLMGQMMADRILLVLAYVDDEPVAGALNFIGNDTLFGRYWGTTADIPYLHFELCYYRAIEEAIDRGLSHVEAGAQGEHKLARGYGPVPTYSAHYIADPAFRAAVADYLTRETAAMESEIVWLEEQSPFRQS